MEGGKGMQMTNKGIVSHTVLHDREELDDGLGAWADEHLSLSRLLGVVDGVQGIVEDGGFDHFGECRFSMA
jgi:hypothetical protein